MIWSLFVLGVSFGSGPCLASCGSFLLPYFTAAGKKPLECIRGYLLFSFGRILVYVVVSVTIFFLGKAAAQTFLKGISKYIYFFGGVFVIILGVMMIIGMHRTSRICTILENHRLNNAGKHLFLLGLIIGILPCGPLVFLMAYIAVIAKRWEMSLVYAAIFGLGTAFSPLVAFSLLAGSFSEYLKKKKLQWQRILNVSSGVLFIFLGIQLLYRIRG